MVNIDGDAIPEERSEHDVLRALGIPADASAGYDILTDDNMPPEKAAELMVACKQAGYDAEGFARHMVTLRKAFREES